MRAPRAPRIPRLRETSRGNTLSLGRALMLALFAMVFGRLVWRATPFVHRTEVLAASPAVSASDARGKKLTLPAPPQRIVSLSPGTTEMLFAIGLKGRIVADTTYCDYPPDAKSLPKIGDVQTSVEKVVAMRPDLVVADAVANRRALEPLERLHLPVFAVPQSRLPEALDALMLLGKITGNATQADSLTRSLRRRLGRAKSAVDRDPKQPTVLAIVESDPLMVVGSSNFMDDIILMAGGRNVGQAAGTGWATFSPERVAAVRPDVILTGEGNAAAVRARPGWQSVPAVRSNAIYSVGVESVRPGPRAVYAVERLAHLLHPRFVPAPR